MNNGGPAFPLNIHTQLSATGMTLRDYFAAAAMQGIVRSNNNRFHPEDDAKWCYEIADAMLMEREKLSTMGGDARG